MGKLVVRNFGVSLDGFSAGPDQSLENPLGVGFVDVMSWFFPTKVFRAMQGKDDGETGIDNGFSEQSMSNMGAWIMGRNMFGPVRGPWPDESWRGWWGPNPPYHVPTFVLTHYARPPIEMEGGTKFIFVTDGIQSALEQARAAAGDKDIRIGGGTSTVRQYLEARLIDEMHLAVPPVLLGRGENLYRDLDLRSLGYGVAETVQGERAMHVIIRKV